MAQRAALINAGLAALFGAVSTILVLIFLLIHVGFPFGDSPEAFTFALLGSVALGSVVVGVPVYILFQRTVLGW